MATTLCLSKQFAKDFTIFALVLTIDLNLSRHQQMHEKHELYRAIAVLAYAMAMVDGELQAAEKKAFMSIIEKELGDDAWVAESRFELLESNLTPTIEHAYNYTLFVINKYKHLVNAQMKGQFIRVMEKIAKAHDGTSQAEEFVIERFKRDINNLLS
jgi:uncharacterized tellurite resistance protein B-like protein